AEAVQKFERALHYLRVTVTSDRVEVAAVRTDGTAIESTMWADGPAPDPNAARTPIAQGPAGAAAGAVAGGVGAAAGPGGAGGAGIGAPPGGGHRWLWLARGGLVTGVATPVVLRRLRRRTT